MKVLDTKTNNAGLETSFSRIKRGKGDTHREKGSSIFIHVLLLLQLLIYTNFPTNRICLLMLREYFPNHWLILL